ncbi:MAG: glycosyltransferase [Zoogloeaceae bacterium]|jgi:GT2 family glycosyltransferase|nr:glycosyltransferase [Zoogloeaceae bacterium]
MLTVVILNYRDAKRSLLCVQNVLAEGADYVLVWDNSADAGMSAADIQAGNPDPERVRIIISPHNYGFAAGVNRAIEFALIDRPGSWILLINNDAQLYHGAIEIMCNVLLENKNARIVSPLINNNASIQGRTWYQHLTGLLFKRRHFGCSSHPSGCCFLLAPERIVLPLFDERFFMYGEDCALGIRFQAPEDIIWLEKVLVFHEGSASSGLGSPFYEERMVAAHLLLARYIAKSRFYYLILLSIRFIVLPVRALVRAIRFRSVVPFVALWRGVLIAAGRDPLRQAISAPETPECTP